MYELEGSMMLLITMGCRLWCWFMGRVCWFFFLGVLYVYHTSSVSKF